MKGSDVLTQLTEIRRQLWLGHASLMVGCGFSRNADKATPTTPDPPDWHQLADELIARLYTNLSSEKRKEIASQKNVLQLADDFDAAFQRPALNQLLHGLIQDNNLLPNKLYTQMLNLPWCDVFTTNYDTLLERAAREIITYKYETVFDIKDLPYSEAPRIIKLHGSFPSEATHLIISEEDYRTYPRKYSPFVNCVQEAIMESVLCLVGFSGTDPNFLKWIGWVKDNLGDSMPRVYLIGFSNFTDAEETVLRRKNIITVDLSLLNANCPNDYRNALDNFFKYLADTKQPFDWPYTKEVSAFCYEPNMSPADITPIIKHWQTNRESYPHWQILPWEKRSSIIFNTEPWTNELDYLTHLSTPWDIDGLFELNWRLEICLTPIFNNLIPQYEEIINRYDPFSVSTKHPAQCNQESQYQEKWLALCFALLRWSREKLDTERWKKYDTLIGKCIDNDTEALNHLFYERTLYAMALPDIAAAKIYLNTWRPLQKPVIWQVKYASLLSEMGDSKTAVELWKSTLNEIRPMLPKGKIKDDFYNLSIEGSILVNLCMADSGLLTSKESDHSFEMDHFDGFVGVDVSLFTSQKSDNSSEQEHDPSDENQARLRVLSQYKCDPRDDLTKFKMVLAAPLQDDSIEHEQREFDKNKKSIHIQSGWKKEILQGFQFMRFMEESGIALRVGYVASATESICSAINRIANYSPNYAFYYLNRVGPKDNTSYEVLYSQEHLYLLNKEQVNELLDKYLYQFKYILNNELRYLVTQEANFCKIMEKILYEVISRLTVKASSDNLQNIFKIGLSLYDVKKANGGLVFDRISRFIKRTCDAMVPEQLFQNLYEILSVKIPCDVNFSWEPPVGLDWRGFTTTPSQCSKDLSSLIDKLIDKITITNDRYQNNILLYLNECIEIGILTKTQHKRLATNLLKKNENDIQAIINSDIFHSYYYKIIFYPLYSKIGIDNNIPESVK